jgi:Ser/Thr protein kinase RdoA (MazF antagonist)
MNMADLFNVIEKWNIPEAVEQIKLKDKGFKLKCVDGTEYFLKAKENVDKIYSEEELLIFLKNNDIPVSVPLRTKDNSLYVSSESVNYCMYKFIKGEHLNYESYEDIKKAVKLYGCVLGKLHSVLNKYKGNANNIEDMDLYHDVFNWAIPTIIEQLKDSKVNSILKDLSNEMKNIFNALPKQYIHRDFHGENVLFEGSKWVGLIDFDLCVRGYKVFDIGYILTSILVTDFSNKEYRNNWVTLIKILIDSYSKENSLTETEKQAIWYILISIQLIFTAYYFGVKNEKLANQNLEVFYWLYDNKDIIHRLADVYYLI